MTSRWRVGALVLAVAMGACSSGGKDDTVTATDAKKTTTTLRVGSDETTTTAAGATGATGTTSKGATATTAKGSTATTAGSAAPAPTAPAADPAPSAAANGTYTYSQSGTSPDGPVPGTGTLVVSNPTYSRYYDQSKPPQKLTYVFRENGAFITGATLTLKGVTVTCSFGDGVAAPPWPAVVGSSSSKTGACGGLTASITSRVTSHSNDIVGLTTTVHAYNEARTIDVTGTDVSGWSISKRVPKTSRQTFSGTAFGSPVSGDVSSTLVSGP